jgi:hypothetical protein
MHPRNTAARMKPQLRTSSAPRVRRTLIDPPMAVRCAGQRNDLSLAAVLRNGRHANSDTIHLRSLERSI